MFLGKLDQNSGVHGNRKPPFTYTCNEEKLGRVRFSAESDHSFWSYLPLSDENFTLSNLKYLLSHLPNLDQILCVALLG